MKPTNTGSELGCSDRIISSFSTSDTPSNRWGIYVSQMTTDICSTFQPCPHSWLIIGFVTRSTWRGVTSREWTDATLLVCYFFYVTMLSCMLSCRYAVSVFCATNYAQSSYHLQKINCIIYIWSYQKGNQKP
jgi:hypothetical protein